MRSAIIENGSVVNVIVGTVEGAIECADEVSIGWHYVDGVFSEPTNVVDLDELKVTLKARVDAAAEAERKRYITAGEGQALTYQRKADEAKACLAASDPQPADYPMLAAEIGITAETLLGVAETVNAAHYAWLAIGAPIERARLGAKVAIDATTTADAAYSVFHTLTWPDA